MKRIKLVPERRSDGSVVLRAVVQRPGSRLRALLRRLGVATA